MNYKIFYIILLFCLFHVTNQTVAQRHFITNQYVYDLYLMNPAEAGANNCLNFNSFYQKQWFGTELAPTTQLLSIQSPLTSNVGSGTYFFNDRNGHNKKMSFQQAFSVKVTLRENSRGFTYLSFGMAALIEQAEVDQTGFTGGVSVLDPAISGGKESGVGFNLNTGFILRINKFNTGFSVTNILNNNNPMYNSEWEPTLPADMHLFASSSYKIPDREVYLAPMAYFRFNSYNDRRLDLNLKATLPTPSPDFAFWGLLSYRRSMDHQFGKNLGFATTVGINYRSLSVGLEHQLGMTTAQKHYGSAMLLVAGYRFCSDKAIRRIPCSVEANGLGITDAPVKQKKGLFRRR